MAANWKSTQGIIKQFWTVNYSSSRFVFAPASASPAVRRAAHSSSYDKNLDDQLRPTVVPDDVIQPLSNKYWAPHPQTGVFGPATEQNSAAGGGPAISTSPATGGHNILLEEEKAWFRPTSLEDLEKPHHI